MSANVHVVLVSRDAVPVSLARLTAAGHVMRLTEKDLVFARAELQDFARHRGVPLQLMDATGGWPALAELVASAGSEVLVDFLWEEVLNRRGSERSGWLARFSACGGGDDEIAAAIAGSGVVVEDIVGGVPLVSRTRDGSATLHSLWQPALRRIISADDVHRTMLDAAMVHRRRGRFSSAMNLLAEADAWDELSDVILEAEAAATFGTSPLGGQLDASVAEPVQFGHWYRLLPAARRSSPSALLAEGIDLQDRDPILATRRLSESAARFRALGNAQGELAAISREGVIHYWADDMGSLVELYGRVMELVAEGVERAETLAAIGLALIAHQAGDSAGVRQALAGIDERSDRGWLPSVQWLRSVAHRRDGDLAGAHHDLDQIATGPGPIDPQVGIARLRIEWLEGDVDRVAEELRRHYHMVSTTRNGFLVREAALEAAARTAWLGDVEVARTFLTLAAAVKSIPNPLATVLETIALVAIAIEESDDETAAAVLRPVAAHGASALGTPGGWYWRDRAMMVVIQVLLPELATASADDPGAGTHAVVGDLTNAIIALRAGDRSVVGSMSWPTAGVVRAHVPRRWAAELVAAGMSSSNHPPVELLASAGSVGEHRASQLVVSVLGPLIVKRDAEAVESPHLRRARVRELLNYLVAFRTVRREVAAEHLWPNTSDGAHNLRVTLNYLNQVFEPDRSSGQRPTYVHATKDWLSLVADGRIAVDLWTLEDHLDLAETAERSTDVHAALAHYDRLLPLWRGSPFADATYSPWAEPVRNVVRSRYIAAALRAGELWLSAGDVANARRAAERALIADFYCEPAHRLLVRTHVAGGDLSTARNAFDACRNMLAELGLETRTATRWYDDLVTR
ncbi:MAG: BTAD domain-containing putative transcriptional regulator [Ilumatobacteraceae bacterium]